MLLGFRLGFGAVVIFGIWNQTLPYNIEKISTSNL